MAYPKGKPKSEESKRKASESMRKRYQEHPEERAARAHFTGKSHTDETKAKMAAARSAYWTMEKRLEFSERVRRDSLRAGEGDGYSALHSWMRRNFPPTRICELCADTHTRTHYAMRNPPHAQRDRDDWLELCPSCHKNYDFNRIVWIIEVED